MNCRTTLQSPDPPGLTPMRFHGRITDWKDEKGFGFITPDDGGRQVFVHISSISDRPRRPVVGERVTFDLKIDPQGRPQAVDVIMVRQPVAVLGVAGQRHRLLHTHHFDLHGAGVRGVGGQAVKGRPWRLPRGGHRHVYRLRAGQIGREKHPMANRREKAAIFGVDWRLAGSPARAGNTSSQVEEAILPSGLLVYGDSELRCACLVDFFLRLARPVVRPIVT